MKRIGENENTVKTSIISPSQLKGDLDNIILMALRKESNRRYASVEDLSNDISKYLNGLPISARPNTFSYRLEKLYQRNKVAFISAIFVILAVLTGLIVSLWQTQVARRQRDLAQTEREKAEKINKFLQQMLSFSNQSFTSISPIAQGKNVSVNEMLDQITPNIEAELADQPEVRSKILRTIGSSYASQGFYEKAEKNLRSALDTQIQIYGEENVETADTMIELGVLIYRQSKLPESSKLLEKAVHFYRKYQADFPNNSPAKFIQALDYLAVNNFIQGDSKTSVSLFEDAVKLASVADLQGHEREVVAGLQADFGGVLTKLGNNERGETLLRQSIDLYTQISNKPRWEVGNAKTLLSVNLINRNDLDAAQKELVEGAAIMRETLGETNLYLAGNLKAQAMILVQKSDFKSAEKMAQESLDVYQKLYSSDNAFSVGTLVVLGRIFTQTARLSEGETYLRRALKVYETQSTKNIALIVPNKIALCENLLAQNQFDEAEKLALETLSEAQQNLSEKNSLTTTAMMNLAKIYEKEGKKDLAQKYGAK